MSGRCLARNRRQSGCFLFDDKEASSTGKLKLKATQKKRKAHFLKPKATQM